MSCRITLVNVEREREEYYCMFGKGVHNEDTHTAVKKKISPTLLMAEPIENIIFCNQIVAKQSRPSSTQGWK